MYLSDNPHIDQDDPIEQSMLPVKYYLQIKDLQKQQIISECLGILITQSEKINVSILRVLEDYRISLGNGAFVLMRICFPELFFPFLSEQDSIPLSDRDKRPDQNCANHLHMQIQDELSVLCRAVFFSHGGDMFALLCLQGESSADSEHYAYFFEQLKHIIAYVRGQSAKNHIPLRFLVSGVHLTVRNISEAYRETCLLEEYASYLSDSDEPLLLWDFRDSLISESQLLTQKEQLFSQLELAIRSGKSDALALCTKNAVTFIPGAYPISRELIQNKAGHFLRELGNTLLEHSVVDAGFLGNCDFISLGSNCTDRQSTLNVVQDFLSSAKNCYQQLSAKLTTDLLLSVQQYIDKNLQDPNLSVTMIADHFHVSRTTLSTRFQRFFGIGMARYIQEHRIALARKLIQTSPSLTLEAVAAESGFSAVSTMYRVFMRLEGQSPGSFRNRLER